MALFIRELGAKIVLDQILCEHFSNDSRAQDQNVHIVVLHALMRGIAVVAYGGVIILLAATLTPTPLPQIRMPRSARPSRIALPTNSAKSDNRKVFVERSDVEHVVAEDLRRVERLLQLITAWSEPIAKFIRIYLPSTSFATFTTCSA